MNTLSDEQLRQRLEEHGFDPGPFSETTRQYWLRKLAGAERKVSTGRRPQPQAKLFNFSSDDESFSGRSPRQRRKSKKRKISERSGSTDEPDFHASIAQRRADAVSRVQAAASRLLDDVKKTHLRDRRTPWYFRFSLHLLVSMIIFVAALLMLLTLDSPVGKVMVGERDVLIWCSYPSVKPEECTNFSRIERAINLTRSIARFADELKGQAVCSGLQPAKEHLLAAEMKEIAKALYNDQDVLVDALRLMTFNRHWKLVVMEPETEIVYDQIKAEDLSPEAVVVSTNPRKPLSCRVGAAFTSAASHFLTVTVSISCIVLVFVGLRKYVRQKEKEREEMFALIDKILGLLKRHHRAYQNGEETVPYVAISHVRDVLLLPSKRQQLSHLWERAAEWIKHQESRVRTETRRIAGEDYFVWRWINIESKNGVQKCASSPTNEADGSALGVEKLRRRENMWGEHVLDHYSSAESWRKQLAPLQKTPSCCIKLHNLFVPSILHKDDEFEELEACVLHKLTQHGGVLHCFLDRWSDEGACYAKLDRTTSATGVIEALHGTWFGGRLVKAEYVPLSEYDHLFPLSKTASKLLFPS